MSAPVDKPVVSFGGALAGGAFVALAGLFVVGPLTTAFDLSFDGEVPALVQALSSFLVLLALGFGGWSAARSAGGRFGTGILGAAVWGAVALAVVHLATLGFDLPFSGVTPGGSGDDVLLPFSRYAAWFRVLSLSASLATSVFGAWAGNNVHGHELLNKARRWRSHAQLRGRPNRA